MDRLKDLYTVSEVAGILGVSDKSVRDFINSGEIQAVKVGQWRISKDAIGAFMDARSNHYISKARAEIHNFLEGGRPLKTGENQTLLIRDYQSDNPKNHGLYASSLMQELPEGSNVQWRFFYDPGLTRVRHIFIGNYHAIVQLVDKLEQRMGGE